MVIDLQSGEIMNIAGGRFLPGLTRRLNNFVKPAFENGVVRDIGKGAEKIGKVIAETVDIKIRGNANSDGGFSGEFEIKAKM